MKDFKNKVDHIMTRKPNIVQHYRQQSSPQAIYQRYVNGDDTNLQTQKQVIQSPPSSTSGVVLIHGLPPSSESLGRSSEQREKQFDSHMTFRVTKGSKGSRESNSSSSPKFYKDTTSESERPLSEINEQFLQVQVQEIEK